MSDPRPGSARQSRPRPSALLTVARRRTRRVFYGWWILIAACYTNGLGGSLHWQGFTVLFLPVSQSLGLSHAATALPFSLSRAEGGLLGPVTGWLIDRYGVRPMMLVGTIVTGVGYLALSRTNSYLGFMLVYLFVISLGASTTFMQATTASLNKWFVRKRGIVMAISSAAFRSGAAVMVPLLSFVVLKYGWQTGAIGIGVLLIVLITPVSLAFRSSPESMGKHPDGLPPRPLAKSPSGHRSGQLAHVEPIDVDWQVRDALRTRAFWVLALGTTLRMSVHGAVFIHFIPILVWKGVEQQTAANLVGLLAGCSVPVILLTGWLSDRLGRQRLLAACYVASAFGLLLLNVVHGTWPIFSVLLLFTGMEAGTALNWSLVGDLFGRSRYATLRGALAPIYNAALLVTPVAAGWVFDSTGSYRPVLIAGSIGLLAAAAVFSQLRPPNPDARTRTSKEETA